MVKKRVPAAAEVPETNAKSELDAKTGSNAKSEPNEKAVPLAPGSTPPEKAEAAPAPAPAKKPRWFRATVIILFGIVYAWDLFAALSNFIGKLDQLSKVNEVRVLNGFAEIATPWAPLVANLVLPVVVFGLALWIARRRNVGLLALMLLAGLGVVAAVSLSLIAYVLTLA